MPKVERRLPAQIQEGEEIQKPPTFSPRKNSFISRARIFNDPLRPLIEEPSLALVMYYRDLGTPTRLTPQQERDLFTRIQHDLTYWRPTKEELAEKLKHYPSMEEVAAINGAPVEAVMRIGRNSEAITQMFLGASRGVIAIAKYYQTKETPPLDDLIQEGNLGVLRAIEKFQPIGARFFTYAIYWIRQSVGRAIDKHGKNIRLPIEMSRTFRDISDAYGELAQELQREPTLQDMAVKTGLTPEFIQWHEQYERGVVFYGSGEDADKNPELTEFLEDTSIDLEERAAQSSLEDIVDDLLWDLPPRERLMLRLRYGIDESEPMSFGDIAQIMGVSRRRVQQIEDEALTKLRKSSIRRRVIEYLPDDSLNRQKEDKDNVKIKSPKKQIRKLEKFGFSVEEFDFYADED